MTQEVRFFYELLELTEKAFEEAPIRALQQERKKGWYYSICATPIVKNKELIFGLNWGADNNHVYEPQKDYPTTSDKLDWKFIRTSLKYFKDYLDIYDIRAINYTNLCFFRSPDVDYLEWDDWKLSMPLFRKYVEFIEPNKAVLLGRTGVQTLCYTGSLSQMEKFVIKGEKKRIEVFKGKLFNKYDLYCVPHPNARIDGKDRDAAWGALFGKK